MRRLTKEEQEIRKSAGIPPRRWLPIVLPFVLAFIVACSPALLEPCIGRLADAPGRVGVVLRFALAYPCSACFLQGGWVERGLFAALWGSIPFAVLNVFWVKRHTAYWDRIRAREKARRAEKCARKSAASGGGTRPEDGNTEVGSGPA